MKLPGGNSDLICSWTGHPRPWKLDSCPNLQGYVSSVHCMISWWNIRWNIRCNIRWNSIVIQVIFYQQNAVTYSIVSCNMVLYGSINSNILSILSILSTVHGSIPFVSLVPLDTELSSRNGTSRRFLTTWFWVIALMRTSLGHLHIIAVTISIGETSPDGQVSIYIYTCTH